MIRQHYKSDWHVFNSKRRSSGLVRATWDEFKKLPASGKNITKTAAKSVTRVNRPATKSSSAEQSTTAASSSLSSSPLETSDTNTDTVAETSHDDSTKEEKPTIIENLSSSFTKLAQKIGVGMDRIENIVSLAVTSSKTNEEEDENQENEENSEEDEEEPIIIEPTVSIFDDKEFDTVEENVAYMESTFGFFIPEREFLTDLSGLVVYLGEKVKLGGICIYCQKQFGPGRSCQHHMTAKSHCKIAYQEDIDVDEFDDFYDFSSSYTTVEGSDGVARKDGDAIDSTLEISNIGELVLTDGRCVGHRAFRKYYKQKYKPEESRESVQIARKEELLKLYKSGGFATQTIVDGKVRSQAISNLSDAEVMSLIVKQHKEHKKFTMIAQRAQKREQYANNRREYKSVTDKLRSSATTTAKIRDYHSMLC
jgi:pre-60S factor REI1